MEECKEEDDNYANGYVCSSFDDAVSGNAADTGNLIDDDLLHPHIISVVVAIMAAALRVVTLYVDDVLLMIQMLMSMHGFTYSSAEVGFVCIKRLRRMW